MRLRRPGTRPGRTLSSARSLEELHFNHATQPASMGLHHRRREVRRVCPCSSVCCMYATKEAIIAMEHEPGLECSIFFMDLHAFGKGFDAYYERAKDLGVQFVRCRPSSVEQIEGSDDLRVEHIDEDGHTAHADFALVVLSVGLKPPEDAKELADKFEIELDGFGFANTKATSPVLTSRDGVYVCGPFSEPKGRRSIRPTGLLPNRCLGIAYPVA